MAGSGRLSSWRWRQVPHSLLSIPFLGAVAFSAIGVLIECAVALIVVIVLAL